MKLSVFIYLVLVGVGSYFRYFANNPTFHYDGFLGAEIIGWICILGIFFYMILQGKEDN